MAVTLRAVLLVLAIGFAVEAAGSAYLYIGGSFAFGAAGVFLGLGPLCALLGVLILWVGRRQWSLVSGSRLHSADVAFGLSVLAMAAMLGLVGWYAYEGASSLPGPLLMGFALAAWAALFLTFATFALIVRDLSGIGGRILLGVGLAWAAGVSAWMAVGLASETGPILRILETHSMQVAPVVDPVAGITGYLAPTYVLLLAAYLAALRRVRAPPIPSGRPSAPPTPAN
jgi:hypothetical protein